MQKNKLINNFSSISIIKHKQKQIVNSLRDYVKENLPKKDELLKLNNDEYRELILSIQNNINKKNFNRLIIKNIYQNLVNYLDDDKILMQSHVYLRASRPASSKIKAESESISFHRESFYGSNLNNAINIWTPINGVNERNTLRFIPNSNLIKSKNIKTKKYKDKYTKKFSNGHKLGFQYTPLKILKGVNLKKNLPMIVPYYNSAVFSGKLIHGSAVNKSNTIRFSCDLRILKKKDYKINRENYHRVSNKPYFVEYKS